MDIGFYVGSLSWALLNSLCRIDWSSQGIHVRCVCPNCCRGSSGPSSVTVSYRWEYTKMNSKPKILPIYSNRCLIWPYVPHKGALEGNLMLLWSRHMGSISFGLTADQTWEFPNLRGPNSRAPITRRTPQWIWNYYPEAPDTLSVGD